MSVNGLLTQVQFVTRGSELTAGASIGATVLTVDSTVDFDDAGGDLEVNGLRYEYVAVDVDALTVTLATTLTAAVVTDDFAASVAGGQVEVDAIAFVTIGEGDDAEVNIPIALRPLLPEGVYDDVPVLLSDDLETIEGFPGRVPVIDGTTFQTASTGERIVIRNDGDGGIIEMFSGIAGETPSILDPVAFIDSLSRRRPTMTIRSGTDPLNPDSPRFRVFSGDNSLVNSGSGAYFEGRGIAFVGLGLADTSSVFAITDFAEVRSQSPIVCDLSVHGADIYADSEAGVGTAAASLTAQGRLIRTPSTRRMKRDIQPMTLDVAKQVLNLEPVTYRLKAEEDGPIYPGFIAEQAATAGADLWVTRNAAGEPTGFRYAEVTAGLVALVKQQSEQIAALQKENTGLTGRLDALLKKLNILGL